MYVVAWHIHCQFNNSRWSQLERTFDNAAHSNRFAIPYAEIYIAILFGYTVQYCDCKDVSVKIIERTRKTRRGMQND